MRCQIWYGYAVSAWPGHERNLMVPNFAADRCDRVAEGQDRFWIPCGGSRLIYRDRLPRVLRLRTIQAGPGWCEGLLYPTTGVGFRRQGERELPQTSPRPATC